MHRYAVAEVGRKQDQVVQPWMFGDPVQKAVALWLVGLPLLLATGPICEERHQLVHKMPPSPDRAHKRSKFFPGIAEAMASQWGPLLGAAPGSAERGVAIPLDLALGDRPRLPDEPAA